MSVERTVKDVGRCTLTLVLLTKRRSLYGCSRCVPQIGEVTGTGGGGVVDGQAYDMVIPVEIELPGGLKKLEIGYNQGQNPFTVAQEFIDKHMLDQNYLREIADYITQRAADYRPPVLGNDEDVNFSGPSGVSASALPAAPQFKYFPVVRWRCQPYLSPLRSLDGPND